MSHFGVTDEFNVAGYMLTDGTMLDFSGQHWLEGWSKAEIEKWKKQNDIRQVDHEDIYEIFPENDNGGDNRLKFMKRGNIRMSPEAPGINILSNIEPTKEQYAKLKEYIRDYAISNFANFFVDIEGKGHEKVVYTGRVSADRIINDIKDYYQTGVVPKGTEGSLSEFYSVKNDKTLGLTDARIDKLLDGSYYGSTNPNYAQAYITYMSPDDYLKLTTGKNQRALERIKKWDTDYSDFNFEKFADNYNYVPIQLNIDEETNEVIGHEGRHRMWQLKQMGYEKVPVLLFNSENKYSKKPMASINLMPQWFQALDDSLDETDRVLVKDLLPFSNGYKEEIKAKYGDNSEADRVFSWKDSEGYLHLDVEDELDMSDFEAYVRRSTFMNNVRDARLKKMGLGIKGEVVLNRTRLNEFAQNLKKYYGINQDMKSFTADLEKVLKTITNPAEFDKAVETFANNIAKKGKDVEIPRVIGMVKAAAWSVSDNLTEEEKYQEVMNELRDRVRQAEAKVKEAAQKQRLIQKIVERELKLAELSKNDKDNHIPDVLKEPLRTLIETVNIDSYVSKGMMANKLTALAKALEKASTQDEAMQNLEMYFDSEGYFVNEIREVVEELQTKVDSVKADSREGTSINSLSIESLKKLNEALAAISHSIRVYDKVLASENAGRVSDRGFSSRSFVKSIDDKKADKFRLTKTLKTFLSWDNLTPVYGYDRFGKGGTETFKGIMDGDDKLTRNSEKIIEFSKSAFTGDQANEWSKEVQTIKVGKAEINITTAQLMSLYCLSKRESAKQHLYKAKNVYGEEIEGQGIVIGAIPRVSERTTPIKVTKEEVDFLCSYLTEEQKAVADKLQEFMSTVCSDWGNYITMKRFGILQFGEENYFPMTVFRENSASLPQEIPQQASIFKLLNMGFTKSLNERGNGALILDSIFDVFIKHSSEMASYNAFALPILDAYRWLSYKPRKRMEHGSPLKPTS